MKTCLFLLLAFPVFGESFPLYLGARGQFTFRQSLPGYNNNDFSLVHRMGIEGGSYRLIGKKEIVGIGMGGTIYSGRNRQGNRYWSVPIHAEFQIWHIPAERIGEGRYYRAGIRTTRFFQGSRGIWDWDRVDDGNISLNIGGGYGWPIGSSYNIRLEGKFGFEAENLNFQLAMNFGRWWNKKEIPLPSSHSPSPPSGLTEEGRERNELKAIHSPPTSARAGKDEASFFWGGIFANKPDYPNISLPCTCISGTIGAQIGKYRPLGDNWMGGLSFIFIIDRYGDYYYRHGWDWAFPANLNLSALRFSSPEKRGIFYRFDLGLSYLPVYKGKWSLTREGYWGMGWNWLVGFGYAFSNSYILQGNLITRHHYYLRPHTTYKSPRNPYAYPHIFLSLGKFF